MFEMTKSLVTVTSSVVTTDSVASKIKNLADDWVKFVDVKESTMATYNRAMKNFTGWLADNNVSTVDRDIVISYRDNLLEKVKPTTARLYIACVRLFIKFLASKGICPDFTSNFKGVKLTNVTHYRDALTIDESKQLIKSMQGNDEKALRDKCIVTLMLATGLRRVEVQRLNVADIEQRGNRLFINVRGKGSQADKQRVNLPAQCAELISQYLKLRGNVLSDAPLFTSISNRNRGGRLNVATISRIAKSALRNAGYDSEKLTGHSLRHSFATSALQAGLDIREVSKALRHGNGRGNVAVTEIYAHDLDALNNTATSTVANLIF